MGCYHHSWKLTISALEVCQIYVFLLENLNCIASVVLA